MIEPILKTIEVPCDQKTAFDVFLAGMDTWWPLGKFTVSAMSGETVKELRVEAKVGGTITEISQSCKEYNWGTIKTYSPYDFIAMDFHITHPSEEKYADSLVEIRFTKLADKKSALN